jgi:hypothetical protein
MSDNERTKAAMLTSFRRWSRENAASVTACGRGWALNAAAAAGLCLEATNGDVTEAIDFAAMMPRDAVWSEAVRYLTELALDEIADTVPPARLTVVR